MTLPPDAVAAARRMAADDRALLARLLREGKVRRNLAMGHNVPGAVSFRADVEGLVRPKVNVAIRPKKKRR